MTMVETKNSLNAEKTVIECLTDDPHAEFELLFLGGKLLKELQSHDGRTDLM